MFDIAEKIQLSIGRSIDRLKNRTVVIYGCTYFSKRIYEQLQRNHILLSAIVDNDRTKAGKRYLNTVIYRPQEYLLPYDPHKMIIVCSVHEQEMLASLKEMGYSDDNIFHISSVVRFDDLDTLNYMQEQIEQVKNGVEIYRKLVSGNQESRELFIAPKASGDVFIAYSFLEEYCKQNVIEDYILAGTASNMAEVAELYGFGRKVRLISGEEEAYLLKAYMFLGKQLKIKVLSDWVLETRNSYFPGKKNRITFEDKFKYEIFHLHKGVKPQQPHFYEETDVSRYDLVKNKTIIIAPYAYSSPAAVIPLSVWEEIAGRLMVNGFKIYTVGYGEREAPLKNTERIQFSYKEAKALLEYAGGFLACRSGLCDIVHSADCRQLIIYGRNIRMEYAIDVFSLKKTFESFAGREIVYEDYEDNQFIHDVVDYFISGDKA